MEMTEPGELTVGVISDTHGLLRPQAAAALAGCGRIVHAGDVGADRVLEGLRRIAPVVAVRGNVDAEGALRGLPQELRLDLGSRRVLVVHDAGRLQLDPQAEGFAVVISGHTHRALVAERDGVLFLNPGSAGPRRFDLPVTVAILIVGPRSVRARTVRLEV